jgi:hypothetical protein
MCYDGMYCLKCKFVVDLSKVNLEAKGSRSYCNPCKTEFVRDAQRRKMKRQRDKILRIQTDADASREIPNESRKEAPKIKLTRPTFKTDRKNAIAMNELTRRLVIRAATSSFIEQIEMDIAASLLITIQPRMRDLATKHSQL